MRVIQLCFLCFLIIGCISQRNRTTIHSHEDDTLKTVVIDTTIIFFPNLLPKTENTNEVYLTLTEKPEYPGGMRELITFIQGSIQYPSDAYQALIQGRVVVQAIIDADGSVIQPSIIGSVDSLLDKEALRIIPSMPKWKPGKYHGKAVKVIFHFPVLFRITDDEKIPTPSYPNEESRLDSLWRKENIWNLGVAPLSGKPFKDLSAIEPPRWAKWNDLEEYFMAHMKYPPQMLRENRPGYTVAMFSLDTLGLPRAINILSTTHQDFGKEVIRLIKKLPHCLPCRDKKGKRIECLYTVYVPFLPQRYKDRVRSDSILEEESKHCFVEWEEQAQFQGGDGSKVTDYIHQHLSYDAKRLGKQKKARGIYMLKIDSYGEVKEAQTLRSCGIPEWDEKVVRIIKGMPRWKPAISHYGKGEYKDAIGSVSVVFENNDSTTSGSTSSKNTP